MRICCRSDQKSISSLSHSVDRLAPRLIAATAAVDNITVRQAGGALIKVITLAALSVPTANDGDCTELVRLGLEPSTLCGLWLQLLTFAVMDNVAL